MAAQFQYDACALAAENMSWPTHYLNLVYTPKVAMSMAVAAEVMRRLPRGIQFNNDGIRMVRSPFVIDGERDFAVCAGTCDYVSSGDTDVPPPSPECLGRVWGCGSSPVVATSGNGCYFLDRVSAGVWRLQLYPSVFDVADPFTGLPGVKTSVLPDAVRMKIMLPEFADGYSAWKTDGGALASVAQKGEIALMPGDYLLTAGSPPGADDLAASAALGVPEFSAPVPSLPYSRPEHVLSRAEVRRLELWTAKSPEEWNFLDARAETARRANGKVPNTRLTRDDAGRDAVLFGADSFEEKSYLAFRFFASGDSFARKFRELGCDTNAVLSVRIRACQPETRAVEMMYLTDDGVSRVAVLPVDCVWRDVKVRMSEFSVAGWSQSKMPRKAPTASMIRKFGFTLGRWLRSEDATGPQRVEISSVRVLARDEGGIP